MALPWTWSSARRPSVTRALAQPQSKVRPPLRSPWILRIHSGSQLLSAIEAGVDR